MGSAEYIAIVGVVMSALSALVTWLVMKRQFASKRLTYTYAIEPILRSSDPTLARSLKVSYDNEELPNPTVLHLDIVNTGLAAIEDAQVVVELPDATYLIPGYFIDIPAGYEPLWSIDRTDAEQCTIKFGHINPKQVARVRLLMDGVPNGDPRISCPMPNVECTRASSVTITRFTELVVQALAPQLLGLLRSRL